MICFIFRVWPKLQFCIFGIFFFFFCNCTFSLSLCGGIKVKLILFIAVTLNGRKFDMLMYPDHLENWLDFGHHLLIFLILVVFWLCEKGLICDFRAFSWEHKGGMVSHLACRCIFTTSRTVWILVAIYWYSSFWRHFDLVKQLKFGVSGIFFRTHGRNSLKFNILMYPHHLWNWLHSGHGLLVFLIWGPFCLSETGQMCSC